MIINKEFTSFTVQRKIIVNEHVVDRISDDKIIALQNMEVKSYTFDNTQCYGKSKYKMKNIFDGKEVGLMIIFVQCI